MQTNIDSPVGATVTGSRASTFILWVIVGCIAAVSCCLNMPSARIGDELLPMGIDAFYHARRILDAVPNLSAFYEFDPKIHAPEGSLLVWPWGYDYFMATLVRLAVETGLSAKPLTALLWMPVGAVFISTGLVILIARRLGLSTWLSALAALCFALAPSTQQLHGFGQIDHHFAEEVFLLASLWAGLTWFQTRTITSAIVLGTILGVSLAIHNGLFILQLPLLATLFVRWLQGDSPPLRSQIALSVSLLVAAVAVLIPSDPFQMGLFEFYTLSWFHFYIVCITASMMLLLVKLKPTRNTIVALVGLGIALVIPLIKEIAIAQSFLTGSVNHLAEIDEVRSPLQRVRGGEALWITYFYSLLIWIAPVTFAVCALQCWRERQSTRLLFWVTAVLGLALLAMQVRMHYFGAFALYLPWLVLAQGYVSNHLELAKRVYLLATLGLLLAYIPQIRHTLIAQVPRASDVWFDQFHNIVPDLQRVCAEDPGVVLADTNAGHYIRYYTNCSVIANNFLLTEQQFRKADEAEHLLGLPASEMPAAAPYVKYVLVRPVNITRGAEGTYKFQFGNAAPKLEQELLLGPPEQVPPAYELRADVRIDVKTDGHTDHVPYAKLYKIHAPTAPAAAPDPSQRDTSLNDIAK